MTMSGHLTIFRYGPYLWSRCEAHGCRSAGGDCTCDCPGSPRFRELSSPFSGEAVTTQQATFAPASFLSCQPIE